MNIKISILSFLIFFLLFTTMIYAEVWTADSTGLDRNSFFTNDSVYIYSSDNITSNSTVVNAYVINHVLLANQTTLTDVTGSSNKSITTNSSGFLPLTSVWSSGLTPGYYDVVVDVNNNGVYDQSLDYYYNNSDTGFQISEQLVGDLTVAVGANSTANHNWYVDTNATKDNVMLQFKITIGAFENVQMNSIKLLASGTGNDKNGILVVKLTTDNNGNGAYDAGEMLLGFDQYTQDDGMAILNIQNGYVLNGNETTNFLIIYDMTNSSGSNAGNTYSFQLATIDAKGMTSGMNPQISGLPISSSVKTVYLSVNPVIKNNTTPSNNTNNNTANSSKTNNTTPSNNTNNNTSNSSITNGTNNNTPSEGLFGFSYTWIIVVIVVVIFVIVILLLLFHRNAQPQPYHYKPQ